MNDYNKNKSNRANKRKYFLVFLLFFTFFSSFLAEHEEPKIHSFYSLFTTLFCQRIPWYFFSSSSLSSTEKKVGMNYVGRYVFLSSLVLFFYHFICFLFYYSFAYFFYDVFLFPIKMVTSIYFGLISLEMENNSVDCFFFFCSIQSNGMNQPKKRREKASKNHFFLFFLVELNTRVFFFAAIIFSFLMF